MRSRSVAGLFACVALLTMAGCGGGGDRPTVPDQLPDDFSLDFDYVAGSVPPPYHDEWRVEIAPGGEGTVAYTPDYAGDGVPVYREKFTAGPADLGRLWETLKAKDLLREDFEPEVDGLVGGAVTSATIEAGGASYEIPQVEGSDRVIDDETIDQIRNLVPSATWRSLVKRRTAYALKKYDQAP